MKLNYKLIYGKLLWLLSSVFGKNFAKKFDSKLRFNRSLDLENPKSLADKVTYLNLYEQNELIIQCTDKYAVRSYIEKKGLESILVPLVGGPWNTVEDVEFCKLPMQFAIKATHGCKMNYLVDNKLELDESACKKEMQRWLDTTYGTYSMEPHYAKIPHRIYAEKFLEKADELIDYKFHCFNGKAQFVLVCSNRMPDGDKAMKVTLDLFDMEWKPIYEVITSGKEVQGTGQIKKPVHFDEMKQIATILAKDFKFVRVDLYEVEGEVYFGELTFSPACGAFPNFTEKFLNQMGQLMEL